MDKSDFFSIINKNISLYGYHVTTVTGGPCPRFSYTIGLEDKIGYELIFAGGENFSIEEINSIISDISTLTIGRRDFSEFDSYPTSLGLFFISDTHPTWNHLLTLGIFDFYQNKQIKIRQILPEQNSRTLDVPSLATEYDASAEPIWKWLTVIWSYPIPRSSVAITNVNSLYGQKVTEVTRWEDNEWEIFAGAGPEVEKEDIRIIPLAILLGIDSSLEPVVNLSIGEGLWRDAEELVWSSWD